MRVAIVGAGPAGLYLSYLLKRGRPRAEVHVLEKNAADATFGFGVVFSERALDFLRDDDAATYDAIRPAMQSWSDITLDVEGARTRIDGVGFSAIGRLELLRLLRERAAAEGVRVEYEHAVTSLAELRDADLVVGADGVNSLVRTTLAAAFGTSVRHLTNRFAWYGTTKRFETLTQTFRHGTHGAFNAHHYRYAPGMSTFIVETGELTWRRTGFESMDAEATRRCLETVFADALEGHALVSNQSAWRRFPQVTNRCWSAGNATLVGDALHTAHFSIGSGTRLALEDAIALAGALAGHEGDVAAALHGYEASRRPIVERIVAAADASAQWYEHFDAELRRPPLEFAMSYITRSGRVDLERLRRASPRFVEAYEASRAKA